MCLKCSRFMTDQVKRKLAKSKRKRLLAWRVVGRGYRGDPISKYQRKTQNQGWYESNREYIFRRRKVLSHKQVSTDEKSRFGGVHYGIHVFLRVEDASKYCDPECMECVMPVWCYEDDLVAAGDFNGARSAVFDRVWITPTAMKEAKQMLKRLWERETQRERDWRNKYGIQ